MPKRRTYYKTKSDQSVILGILKNYVPFVFFVWKIFRSFRRLGKFVLEWTCEQDLAQGSLCQVWIVRVRVCLILLTRASVCACWSIERSTQESRKLSTETLMPACVDKRWRAQPKCAKRPIDFFFIVINESINPIKLDSRKFGSRKWGLEWNFSTIIRESRFSRTVANFFSSTGIATVFGAKFHSNSDRRSERKNGGCRVVFVRFIPNHRAQEWLWLNWP